MREQGPFEKCPENQRQRHPQQQSHEQAAGGAAQHKGQVGPNHVKAAMGQIDDAHDAEHQRQPACHQKKQQAVLQGVQRLDQERSKIHEFPLPGSKWLPDG